MTVLADPKKTATSQEFVTSCRICCGALEAVLDFGPMPLANGFLTKEQIAQEYFFPLKLAFCPTCSMVQLVDQPDPEKMFHESYPFFSASSQKMKKHFADLAERVKKKYLLSADPFVIEIGSNDGTLLKHYAHSGIRHLGIEPSENVALKAREEGVETLSSFFSEGVAENILEANGQADVILAANVMCHMPDLQSVVLGIKKLLKEKGVFIFEDPYLGEIFKKTAYDQIYDEHVFYFSLHSLSFLFSQHGMEVIDVEPQTTHGGSMRYTVARKGSYSVSRRAQHLFEQETEEGLRKKEILNQFHERCKKSKRSLKTLLSDLKKQGKRVMGYAATSKSTTVLNYCEIGPELVESICDTTPLKQGRLSPGMHIPICSHEDFQREYPDYALLFGWNHQQEIMAKEDEFNRRGGKWIVFVPEVQIL